MKKSPFSRAHYGMKRGGKVKARHMRGSFAEPQHLHVPGEHTAGRADRKPRHKVGGGPAGAQPLDTGDAGWRDDELTDVSLPQPRPGYTYNMPNPGGAGADPFSEMVTYNMPVQRGAFPELQEARQLLSNWLSQGAEPAQRRGGRTRGRRCLVKRNSAPNFAPGWEALSPRAACAAVSGGQTNPLNAGQQRNAASSRWMRKSLRSLQREAGIELPR
jgi:hypothetical protein